MTSMPRQPRQLQSPRLLSGSRKSTMTLTVNQWPVSRSNTQTPSRTTIHTKHIPTPKLYTRITHPTHESKWKSPVDFSGMGYRFGLARMRMGCRMMLDGKMSRGTVPFILRVFFFLFFFWFFFWEFGSLIKRRAVREVFERESCVEPTTRLEGHFAKKWTIFIAFPIVLVYTSLSCGPFCRLTFGACSFFSVCRGWSFWPIV